MEKAESFALLFFKASMAFLVGQWLAIPLSSREALLTLAMFVVFDIVTGIWASFVAKKVSSDVGIRGVSKKIGMFAALLLVHLVEDRSGVELNLEFGGAFAYTVIEIVSTVENLANIGVPIPKKLVEVLIQVKKIKVESATKEDLKALHEAKES